MIKLKETKWTGFGIPWKGWKEFIRWQARTLYYTFFDPYYGNKEFILLFGVKNSLSKGIGHKQYFFLCPVEYFMSLFLQITVRPFYYLFISRKTIVWIE